MLRHLSRGWGLSTSILSVLMCAFLFLLALTRISNYDIWFHLATGRTLLASGFPATDPFTYTQPDTAMYLGSWLFGVMAYGFWQIGGAQSLTLTKAILVLALFGLLWLTVLRRPKKASPEVEDPATHPAFGVVVAAFAMKFRLFLRPHLLEFLILAGAIYLLHRYRWRWSPLVPGLIVLQIFWGNVHGSFPLGLSLPMIFLAGDIIDSRLGRPIDLRQAFSVACGATLALVLASAINPLGFSMLAVPISILGRGQGLWTLGEYQPLRLAHFSGFFFYYTWGFVALIALGLLGLAAQLLRGKRPAAWECLLFAIFIALPPVVGMRFIAEFAVVASPLVIRFWLAALPRKPAQSRQWKLAEVGLALCLPAIYWLGIVRGPVYQVGLGEKLDKFPAAAVSFLKTVRPTGPMFNSLGFGGYLIWNYPESKVFIDGRWPVYTEEFFDLSRNAHTDPVEWSRIEERFGPQVVIIEYLTDFVGRERMPHLETNPSWALVFWDPVSKVYVKRTPENAELAERYAYHLAKPARFELQRLAGFSADPPLARQALSEYERALRDNPRNAEALAAIAFLTTTGPAPDWQAGIAAANRALTLRPSTTSAYASLCRGYRGSGQRELAQSVCSKAGTTAQSNPHAGMARRSPHRAVSDDVSRAKSLFEQGVARTQQQKYEEAVNLFRQSLELNPTNTAAMTNLGFCLNDLGRHEEAIRSFESVLERDPKRHDALFGLAMANEQLARRDEALALWTRYLQQAPASPWKQIAEKHVEALRGGSLAPDSL